MKLFIKQPAFLCCLLLLGGNCLLAQKQAFQFRNTTIVANANKSVVELEQNNELGIADIIANKQAILGAGPSIQLQEKMAKTDNLGITHNWYKQYVNGMQVLYGEISFHSRNNGKPHLVTGNIINENDEVSTRLTSASLNKASLLGNAARLFKNKILAVPTHPMEFADGATVLFTDSDTARNNMASYITAFVIDVELDNWDSYRLVYNAGNMRLLRKTPLFQTDCFANGKRSGDLPSVTSSSSSPTQNGTCTYNGSFATFYNGNQSQNTTKTGNLYKLYNDCNATPLYVYDANRDTSANPNYLDYTDADNNWIATEGSQIYFGMKKTMDYYKTNFARPGMKNDNSTIYAYGNWMYKDNKNNVSGNNATHYGNHVMVFGYGGSRPDSTDDVVHLDVTAHEFTHGVTQEMAAIIYEKEAGAINESLSDIFAKCADAYNNGTNLPTDWLIKASSVWTLRSLSNPESYGQPSIYKDPVYYYPTDGCDPNDTTKDTDNCGVHTNSGVMNRWFFMLASNGTTTFSRKPGNDDMSVSVTGIGLDKMQRIMYQAFQYYGTNPTFFTARNATLQAAKDLYGNCSPEAIMVGKAWAYVNVGTSSQSYNALRCGTLNSGTLRGANKLIFTPFFFCNSTDVNPGITINAFAGNAVVMTPGFTAKAGSYFDAYIQKDDCLYQELN